MDDWGLQDFSGGDNCICGGNSKTTGIGSGAWRCDWSATTSYKTWMEAKLLLKDEQWKLCLEMESVPGEDAVKIVEMTTEDLEYHIDLVHKAAAGLEWIDSNFERNAMDKMLSKQHFMLQRKHSWREESVDESNFIVLFQASPAFNSHHPNQSVPSISR